MLVILTYVVMSCRHCAAVLQHKYTVNEP